MLLTYEEISSTISKFSGYTLLDSAELSGSTNIDKLSDAKLVKCVAHKLVTEKDLSCGKNCLSRRKYSLGVLQIDFTVQTALILLNKLMSHNCHVFPDSFHLSSISNYELQSDLLPGDTLKSTISIIELSASSATFEAIIEINNNKSSKCKFSLSFSETVERSLCIIKPDAIKAGLREVILETMRVNQITVSNILVNSNRVIMGKYKHFTQEDCKKLYEEHINKSFYKEIEEFMTSGWSFVCCIEGPQINSIGCIQRYRNLIGDTDPSKAASGTIRSFAGSDKGHNAIHGSDSSASAYREIPIFFPEIRFWSKISD